MVFSRIRDIFNDAKAETPQTPQASQTAKNPESSDLLVTKFGEMTQLNPDDCFGCKVLNSGLGAAIAYMFYAIGKEKPSPKRPHILLPPFRKPVCYTLGLGILFVTNMRWYGYNFIGDGLDQVSYWYDNLEDHAASGDRDARRKEHEMAQQEKLKNVNE